MLAVGETEATFPSLESAKVNVNLRGDVVALDVHFSRSGAEPDGRFVCASKEVHFALEIGTVRAGQRLYTSQMSLRRPVWGQPLGQNGDNSESNARGP